MTDHLSQSGESRGEFSNWQDRVPEELIQQLVDADEFVVFTDEWRALSEAEQLDHARHWLRKTLGMEDWR